MKKLVILAALVLLGPATASAQVPAVPQEPSDPAGQPQATLGAVNEGAAGYIAARVGAIIPKSDDLDGFDNGLALEGVIGRRMNPNIALEASVGYFSMGASASGGGASVSLDISAFNLGGTIKVIAPVEKVDFYALAGAGVYFISADGEASGIYSGSASDDGTSLGVTLGGGIAARLSPQATLGAEAKYLLGDVNLFEETNNYNSLILGGMLSLHF